jgi:hypothetical protein
MSRSSARTTAAALLLGASWVGAFAAAISACGDIGDASYVPPQVTPLNQVDLANQPWCVDTCAPDYGSTRINCKAEEGLEFFPVDVLNPDNPPPLPGAVPPITGFYAYNDGTSDFMVAGPQGFNGNTVTNNDNRTNANGASNYQPDAVLVHDRCGADGKPGDAWVHHLRGGLFTEWGGGMGRRLQNFVTAGNSVNAPSPACSGTGPASPTDPDYCPDADERIESVADLPGNANLRGNFYGMVADLRGWEGISFWARQGPNNTAAIRVYVADRQLDEDVSALEYNAGLTPLCGRARECGCRNHRPCTSNAPDDGYSCWDPQLDTPPAELRAQTPAGGTFYNPYDICGSYLCDADNPAWPGVPDKQFATPDNTVQPGTAQCQLYKLTNDLQTYYCYDQNEPRSLPPDAPDQCGDGWEKGVALTTDWQFYTIPFTELRQEGYGKMFSYLDLSKITLVRFSWMQGWLDVWLDDVRFYRHAGSTAQTP